MSTIMNSLEMLISIMKLGKSCLIAILILSRITHIALVLTMQQFVIMLQMISMISLVEFVELSKKRELESRSL